MMNGRGHERKTEVVEILAQIREHLETSTAHMARVAGGIYNGVLDVFTMPIDSSGVITRNWHVACGSVVIFNETTAPITVTPDGANASAPAQGVGVTIIAAKTWKAIPLASHLLTIYGTPDTGKVNVQAFTGMQALIGGGPM